MLDTVVSALTGHLREKGIDARPSFPDSYMGVLPEPVAVVGVRSSKSLSSGAGEYLGLRIDPHTLDSVELYGYRLELRLSLDIFSPKASGSGAQECLDTFGKVCASMSSAPSGLKINEMCCGEVLPDKLTDTYRCPCEIGCTAYIICEMDEEIGEFLDFELKGVMRNDQ